VSYPPAAETRWGRDYGPRVFDEIERPYVDDTPAHGRGIEGRSRWGSRPARGVERVIDPGGRASDQGFFHVAWARLRGAVRHGG
jgi:hypothetical protein